MWSIFKIFIPTSGYDFYALAGLSSLMPMAQGAGPRAQGKTNSPAP
jgi:hypothetical protein